VYILMCTPVHTSRRLVQVEFSFPGTLPPVPFRAGNGNLTVDNVGRELITTTTTTSTAHTAVVAVHLAVPAKVPVAAQWTLSLSLPHSSFLRELFLRGCRTWRSSEDQGFTVNRCSLAAENPIFVFGTLMVPATPTDSLQSARAGSKPWPILWAGYCAR
jgi:hypothetical protein